jgi:rhamnosyltransferase
MRRNETLLEAVAEKELVSNDCVKACLTSATAPRVSVGILTRNGGKVFKRVMEALGGQRTAWPFEVVVLDSASRDGTDRIAEQHGARVVAYRPKRFKFGPARDTLFENCRGEIIVTISQDVVPASADWLATLTRPLVEGIADATIGEQAEPPGTYTFYWDYHGSWLRSVAIQFDLAYGRIGLSCANLAIRRGVWEKLRFGDCDAIEDRAMQMKLHESGLRMIQVKGALSYHGHDYTWKQLYDRNGSFAFGWKELGWPYTSRRLLRDLVQPSRYLIAVEAFMQRKLRSWKEFLFPVAMCFMQWHGSRRKSW